MQVKCSHIKRGGKPCGYKGIARDGKVPLQCPRCKQYGKLEQVS